LLALIKAHCRFMRNVSLPIASIQILVHHSWLSMRQEWFRMH